jgi:hypothetical protein
MVELFVLCKRLRAELKRVQNQICNKEDKQQEPQRENSHLHILLQQADDVIARVTDHDFRGAQSRSSETGKSLATCPDAHEFSHIDTVQREEVRSNESMMSPTPPFRGLTRARRRTAP